MGFNVTGQEVASGVHDPTVMFAIVAIILIIGIIVFGIFYLVNNIK